MLPVRFLRGEFSGGFSIEPFRGLKCDEDRVVIRPPGVVDLFCLESVSKMTWSYGEVKIAEAITEAPASCERMRKSEWSTGRPLRIRRDMYTDGEGSSPKLKLKIHGQYNKTGKSYWYRMDRYHQARYSGDVQAGLRCIVIEQLRENCKRDGLHASSTGDYWEETTKISNNHG